MFGAVASPALPAQQWSPGHHTTPSHATSAPSAAAGASQGDGSEEGMRGSALLDLDMEQALDSEFIVQHNLATPDRTPQTHLHKLVVCCGVARRVFTFTCLLLLLSCVSSSLGRPRG